MHKFAHEVEVNTEYSSLMPQPALVTSGKHGRKLVRPALSSHQNTEKGYIRASLLAQDYSIYSVFYLDKDKAYQAVVENCPHSSVRAILKKGILKALSTSEFIHYLNETESRDVLTGLLPFTDGRREDAEQHAEDPNIIRAYIDYHFQNQQNPGAAILKALAFIQQINLRLWQCGSEEQLIPFDEEDSESILINDAPCLDLLFEGERIESIWLIGYAEGPINESIFPLQAELITRFQAVWRTLKLGLPMAASYTFSFAVLATGIMIGHMNGDKKNNLDAITLINAMNNTITICSVASLYSISILTSNERGQLLKNLKRVSQNLDVRLHSTLEEKKKIISLVIKNGLIMATITLPIPFLLMFFSKSVLTDVFGQDEEVAQLAQNYLRPFSFTLPGILSRMCFEQVMFSFEKQNSAMLIGLTSFGIGVTLADLMGFGHWFFPDLGIAGVAWGFVAEAWLTAFGFGLFLGTAPTFKEFHFFKNLKLMKEGFKQLKELARIGLPITLTLTNEIAASFVINILAGILGEDSLAAQEFATQLSVFAIIPIIAFGQAGCQEVSRERGKRNYENARRISSYSLIATLSVMTPICLVACINPRALASVISSDLPEDVLVLIDKVVPITAAGIFFDAIRYGMLQILRSVEDHMIPTIISISNIWGGTLLAYLLGFEAGLGVTGIAIGYTLGLAGSTFSLLPRWLIKTTPEALLAADLSHAQIINVPKKIASNQYSLFACCRRRQQTNNDNCEEELAENLSLQSASVAAPVKKSWWRSLCCCFFGRDKSEKHRDRDPVIDQRSVPLLQRSVNA